MTTACLNLRMADRFDRLAIGLSGLCIIHCLGTALLVALAASTGGMLLDPIVHEAGLMLAIVVGVFALGRGILAHGFMLPSAVGAMGLGVMSGALTLPHDAGEVIYTIIGVTLLAFGHELNRRAGH